MTATIPLHHGTFTLPEFFTAKFGLKSDDVIIIEDTPQGILLKPNRIESTRVYSDEEMTQWESEERALEPHRQWLEAELAKVSRDESRWGS
ncbi:MAG: hypothetical protein ACKVY0_17400 [Prosthecobacter sp.]|uniref:hypothetical protein n=1 Tax=Prosthecobacter sp. TaxID=1965333 RepID=UPI003903EB5A